jgi:hypothetical protein
MLHCTSIITIIKKEKNKVEKSLLKKKEGCQSQFPQFFGQVAQKQL